MFDRLKFGIVIVFLLAIVFLLYKNFVAIQDLSQKQIIDKIESSKPENSYENNFSKPEKKSVSKEENNIDELSSEEVVIKYLKENHKLPDYYITKKEARNNGWESGKGNLCDVLPNRVIGGDIFTNRQKILPTENGRIYFEADLNYNCGRRNADRVVFSNDGLIFVTHDHYDSFDQK